jgi:hypothetical protein
MVGGRWQEEEEDARRREECPWEEPLTHHGSSTLWRKEQAWGRELKAGSEGLA